jgi:hypothetical protein
VQIPPYPPSAWVAQLAEHVFGKDEVAGSIPASGSRDNKVRIKTYGNKKETIYQASMQRLQKNQLFRS